MDVPAPRENQVAELEVPSPVFREMVISARIGRFAAMVNTPSDIVDPFCHIALSVRETGTMLFYFF